MVQHVHKFQLEGTADTDILDVTDEVLRAVAESGVGQGLAQVFVPGSTAAVTCIEYEDGALADLREAVERLAPREAEYAHNLRWGDGNGYSHVRAALLGPYLGLPVMEGRPVLGTWQQVVVLDFDNRPRSRRVLVQVLGE